MILPLKGMTEQNITQTFHPGHQALDIVSYLRWNTLRGYGTPLCAPEDFEITRITGDTFTPGSDANLGRGYGIHFKGLETGIEHIFWHTLPFHPVNVGDKGKKGQIIASMGNAGYVKTYGTYVPINQRTNPPHPGTHLHWEGTLNGQKINPLDYLDFTKEPQYTRFDEITSMMKVLAKMSKALV